MNLELLILSILSESPGYLLPEKTLIAGVRLRALEAPTSKAMAEALDFLGKMRQVTTVANADTGNRYQIADGGQARLRNAGL